MKKYLWYFTLALLSMPGAVSSANKIIHHSTENITVTVVALCMSMFVIGFTIAFGIQSILDDVSPRM